MNRRAVSPVIATLLLIAIAVAASVVTYTWVMSMAANQSQQSQTSVKIDLVHFTDTTHATITFRNTGSVAATIDEIYSFDGDAIQKTIDFTGGPVIISSQTEVFTINLDGDVFAINMPYRIRAITTTGFIIEGTFFAPGSF